MARTIGVRTEDLDVHKSHKAGLMSSHTLWNQTVYGLFQDMTSAQGLCNELSKRQAITSETTYYLDDLERSSILIILQVVRWITTSKDGFAMPDAEILNSLKD